MSQNLKQNLQAISSKSANISLNAHPNINLNKSPSIHSSKSANLNTHSNKSASLNAGTISSKSSSSSIHSSLNSNPNSSKAQAPNLNPNSHTPPKQNILDFTKPEFEAKFDKKFRVKQIFEWIYQKYADDFSQMSSLPKSLREELEAKYHFAPLKCVKFEQSEDTSVKYLFRLSDGLMIESVLLPMQKERRDESGKLEKHARYTICVSSQVGCKSGCSFCLTAKGGLKRNLTAGEIVAQILWIKKQHQIPYERRVNVVYMGMGEPLDNLANVSKAVRILSDNDTLAIAPRRQTISTSGLARQITELGSMKLGVLLAISLHAVNDVLRSELMPINKAYNIAAIMDAVRAFPIDARKRVMFEYLLLGGLNDGLEHAAQLVRLLNGIKAKVNLILFNPHEGSTYRRPSLESAVKFQDFLSAKGITCTIRESKGLDISAACGQLKERSLRG